MSQRQLMQLIEDETKFNEVSEEMFKYVNLDEIECFKHLRTIKQ